MKIKILIVEYALLFLFVLISLVTNWVEFECLSTEYHFNLREYCRNEICYDTSYFIGAVKTG